MSKRFSAHIDALFTHSKPAAATGAAVFIMYQETHVTTLFLQQCNVISGSVLSHSYVYLSKFVYSGYKFCSVVVARASVDFSDTRFMLAMTILGRY